MNRYNYLSPDGIFISPESFPTRAAADAYLANWIKRYEAQGYYSSNSGRISLEYLKEACELVAVPVYLAELHEHIDAEREAILIEDGDGAVGLLVIKGQNFADGVVPDLLTKLLEGVYDTDVTLMEDEFAWSGKYRWFEGTIRTPEGSSSIYLTIVPKYS